MPFRNIKVLQRHKLGTAQALARLKDLAEKSQNGERFQVIDAQWTQLTHTLTFTVSTMGVVAHGRVEITPEIVSVETDTLPWIAVPFVLFIEPEIQRKLAEALK